MHKSATSSQHRATFIACGALLLAGFASLPVSSAKAEPTEIIVRVIGKDAKFIGTPIGGMRITLRDAETHETLATGITSGTAGQSKFSMDTSGGRRAVLSDPTAAKFVATLDLSTPRLIEVEAYGPLAQLQSANRVVATQWVVPGRGIANGDGWLLELPGLIVDVLDPPAHLMLPASASKAEIHANVTMMCGCPIAPKSECQVYSRSKRSLSTITLKWQA
jgi:hypothetical protein